MIATFIGLLKLIGVLCVQVVDNGAISFCKLWGTKPLHGAMADDQGTGEAQKGETQVKL